MIDYLGATQELYKCFDLFNQHLFKNILPKSVILIQSKGKKKNEILGWFTTSKVWNTSDEKEKQYEITIVAEYLNRDYLEILQTLLHEMNHLYNTHLNIKDCNRKGKHNENFKASCMKHGMEFVDVEDESLGWAFPVLTEQTKELIQSWNIPKDVFNFYRLVNNNIKPSNRKPVHKYQCPTCGLKIMSYEEEISVLCNKCSNEFINQD